MVRDAKGGVLPGANVVAFHVISGRRSERQSDAEGRFTLPALSVGDYQVFVELSGFKRFEQHGLTLNVGQKVDLPIVLELGQLSEAITVTADAPLLRTANAEIAEIIDNRQVQALPLNGRQFIQLAQLTDGVTIPPGGTRGAALGQAGPLPNVYGQRGGHNIYLIDGVKVTDEYFNNLVISPSVDAIQEFKIQKTMYPAEFGGKASALINVVTKSGTNPFHGSALEFVRNASSMPATTSTIQPGPCRRCVRTSSASISAARSDAIGRSSSSAMRDSGCGRRRRRPFPCRQRPCALATSPAYDADLRSVDAHRRRYLHGLFGQPDSGRPDRPGGTGAAGQGAAADERRTRPEPALGETIRSIR